MVTCMHPTPSTESIPHPMNARERQLAHDPIRKLIIQYSVPAIIGMLVNAFYNVVDRFWIGQLHNTAALSGIGLTLPMSNILLGFMLMISVGSTATISLKLGARKHKDAEMVLANALTLSLIVGTSLSLIGLLWLEPMLKTFGASLDTLPYAVNYLRIILYGNVFNTIGFALNSSIRGAGNPKRSASTQLLGAGLNMVLDPLFILGFGWGVEGAAWATIISQFISMLWVVSYFAGKTSHLKLHPSKMPLQLTAVRQILAIGVSPLAMQISFSFVAVLANRMLRSYGGDPAIGAMTIVTSIAILFQMPLFGINQGVQPILGYNYGAKAYARVRETWQQAIIIATSITVFGTIVVMSMPGALIRLFSSDPQVIEIGTFALRAYLLMLPFLGFQFISTIYFQSIGHARIAMFSSLMRQVIFLIPLYLILPRFWGLKGVWLASPIADLVAVIVTSVLIILELKRLKRLEREFIESSAPIPATPPDK
ncbi:MAG: MATE family efflux transporter [Eubacteriales bacterium]|nr:MATE family efflux transporter [Eubacteriales bacterium]